MPSCRGPRDGHSGALNAVIPRPARLSLSAGDAKATMGISGTLIWMPATALALQSAASRR